MKARRQQFDELVADLLKQSATKRRATLAVHRRVVERHQRPPLKRKPRQSEMPMCAPPSWRFRTSVTLRVPV